MRHFTGGSIFLAGGAAIGALSAFLAIQNAGVEPAASGSPWLSRAAGLAGNAGYYTRAHYLLYGRLPPAAGQLNEASAETDSEGQSLSTSCNYVLTSTGPLPKWWSIAAIASMDESVSRQAISDADSVIRETNGSVQIQVAPYPQPGNWLKAPASRSFTLLYSAVPLGGPPATAVPPFNITREGC
jgi:hypothetical protein